MKKKDKGWKNNKNNKKIYIILGTKKKKYKNK